MKSLYLKNNPSNYLNFFKVCLSFIGIRYLVVILLALIAVIFETFALTSVLPLLSNLFENESSKILKTDLFGDFFNNFFIYFNEKNLNEIFIITIILIAFRTIVLILTDLYRIKIRFLLLSGLRKKILKGVFLYNLNSEDSNDSGFYNNLISEQTDKYSKAFDVFIRIIIFAIQATFLLIISLSISFKLNIIIFLTFIIFYPIFKIFSKKIIVYSKNFTNEATKLSSLVNQSIQSIEYLKITNQEKKFNDISFFSIKEISRYLSKMGFLNAITGRSVDPLIITLLIIFYIIGTNFLNYDYQSIMLSFIFLFKGISNLISIQQKILGFNTYSGPIKKINDELIKIDNSNLLKFQTSTIDDFKKDIIFKNVSFTFKENNKNIFDKINFKIDINQIVAIVGPSGSGKSTFIKIFALILKPYEGSILIDNKIIDNKLNYQNWRDKIGYISQKLFIYKNTIINNITMSFDNSPPEKLDMNLIIKLSKILNIYEFIQSLPNKFNQEISEMGKNISSGQIQRILILRELYRKKSILIFDEPTSSLDQINKNNFLKLLNELKNKYTILLITHDPDIIKKIPTVYEIQNNKMIKV